MSAAAVLMTSVHGMTSGILTGDQMASFVVEYFGDRIFGDP